MLEPFSVKLLTFAVSPDHGRAVLPQVLNNFILRGIYVSGSAFNKVQLKANQQYPVSAMPTLRNVSKYKYLLYFSLLFYFSLSLFSWNSDFDSPTAESINIFHIYLRIVQTSRNLAVKHLICRATMLQVEGYWDFSPWYSAGRSCFPQYRCLGEGRDDFCVDWITVNSSEERHVKQGWK